MKAVHNREGFWYSHEEPGLPRPVAEDWPWPGQDEFLSALEKVEEKASITRYRGWSTCRLCGKPNGTATFASGKWQWPQGFRHYVQDHNVRPSLAFQEFILGREVE